MSEKDYLNRLVEALPEDRVRQLLDFARFLRSEEEHGAWQEFGRRQFAQAYGDDEPEYSEADIKSLPRQGAAAKSCS